ncbi:MAG: hypothetical protein H6609_16270 [Ignavibacteriales bacterium]|nr:hypothetical protein [Ignavibacteriales bacterium]
MDDNLHSHLASLEEELSKLKEAVEYIEVAKISVEAADKIIDGAKTLQIKVEEHAKLIEDLIKKIDKVDFPSRLDKIDTVIATINQNISNLQSRLDSIESNIKDEVKQNTFNILTFVEKTFNKNEVLSNRILKKENILIILLVVVIIFLIGLGILIKI